MFNTPPVVPIYTALENLRWIKANGGVEAMEKLAKERADIVYGEIDRNKLFRGTVKCEEDRSYMNICFVLNDEYAELQDEFLLSSLLKEEWLVSRDTVMLVVSVQAATTQ